MNHLGTVILESERLILRRCKVTDTKDMYNNWANSDKVTKFLTWPTHESIEITKSIIDLWISKYRELETYQWCIEWKKNQQVIGSISVVHMDENIDEFEIGYCIGESYWNMGITTEAFREVIKFLFEVVQCNRITAKHDVNNPNSGKVMKKAGLEYEGTMKAAGKNIMGICDLVVYGITKEMYLRK